MEELIAEYNASKTHVLVKGGIDFVPPNFMSLNVRR